MTITATLSAKLTAKQTDVLESGVSSFTVSVDRAMSVASAAEFDVLLARDRVIDADSNDDLDLAGVLSDAMGSVIDAAEIFGFLISAGADNPGPIVVGAAATNPVALFGGTTHTIAVQPGGVFMLAAPSAGSAAFDVVDATADVLRINNPDIEVAASYTVALLGKQSSD